MTKQAVGVYRTTNGWAAFDREGRTWRVSEVEARQIKPGAA